MKSISSDTNRQRRNVRLHGRRTSVSLELAVWDTLETIGRQENETPDALATMVDDRRQESSLASALRIFSLLYFRLCADTYQQSLQRRPMPGVQEDPTSFLQQALDMFAATEANGGPID